MVEKQKKKATIWSKFQVHIVKIAVFVYCFLLFHLLLLAVKLMLSLYPQCCYLARSHILVVMSFVAHFYC